MTTTRTFDELRDLADNWDGEGAPRPEETVIAVAEEIVRLTTQAGLPPYDIDADVLGGVALWYCAKPHAPRGETRTIWVAMGNCGSISLSFSSEDGTHRTEACEADDVHKRVLSFFSRSPVSGRPEKLTVSDVIGVLFFALAGAGRVPLRDYASTIGWETGGEPHFALVLRDKKGAELARGTIPDVLLAAKEKGLL